jgi:hypothetical protein
MVRPETLPAPAGASTRNRSRLRAGVAIAGALALVGAGATAAIGAVTTPNTTTLKSVGPAGPYGFPAYYEDSTGLKLEQCLDVNEEMCDPAFLLEEGLNADLPLAIGASPEDSNWPGESFYFQSGATADTTAGGDAVLVMALEATFANEEAKQGDQVVFGRLRIRVDTPDAGTYTVIHPYGVDTFEVTEPDDGINMTQDITPAPDNFGLALRSRIAPFLRSTSGTVETETGTYLANPANPTTVTGSPFDTNFFRVTGPDGQVIAETEEFTLLGKVSTNNNIDPISATVSEDEDGMYLNVHANAGDNDAVTVSGEGVTKTTLTAGGPDGTSYFARVPIVSAPSEVTVRNESDKPVATKTMKVTDLVTVTGAAYSTESQELVITATTSDSVEAPKLSYEGEALTGGTLTMSGVAVPPASVTVTSAGGGTDTAPVSITGAGIGQAETTTAIVSAPLTALAGDEVTLDGSSSVNAARFQWEQTDGPAVDIAEPTAKTTSFTAPSEAGTVKVKLTTSSADGSTTATSEITVEITAADQQPLATATASNVSPLIGQSVTIDGSKSTNAKSYLWKQTDGAAVTFDAKAPSITFAMPNTREPLSFSLVVTSPTGVASEAVSVTVAPKLDVLTVTSAEVRTGKNEWRIAGTATMWTGNTVSVYTKTSTGAKGRLIGTAVVAAPAAGETAGTWDIRSRGTVSATGVTRLIVESTKGGLLNDVTFSTRR